MGFVIEFEYDVSVHSSCVEGFDGTSKCGVGSGTDLKDGGIIGSAESTEDTDGAINGDQGS